MELKTLPDQELFDLIQDKKLNHGLLEEAEKEFLIRNFTIETVDVLGMNYEAKRIKSNNKDLSIGEKLAIIVFPFVPPLQAIFANKHLAKNNRKAWKQHWNYVAIGFIFWTITAIIYGRLLLSK